jgi:hypothetical protein
MAAPAPKAGPAKEVLLLELALPPLGVPVPGKDKVVPLDLTGTSLHKYADAGNPAGALRKVVRKAQVTLWACSPQTAPRPLQAEVMALRKELKLNPAVLKTRHVVPRAGTERRFKEQLLRTNRDLARVMAHIEDVLEELDGVEAIRDGETARWQAHYDLVRTWLLARQIALDEQALAIGTMRKELPPYNPGEHGAWQLTAKERVIDTANKKRLKQVEKAFERLEEQQRGTVWAELAKRGRQTELGCEWRGAP